MHKDELLTELTATIGKTKVLELSRILREQQFALKDLIDLTFYADMDIAFRAAWILENLLLKNPLLFIDDLDYLISRVKSVKHASCQRHYTKILMHLTAPKVKREISDKMNTLDLEPVVEQCFDWMIDPKIKIAVKVFSSEVLFHLCDRYNWVKDELAEQIQFLMKTGSPGIISRGKKILKELVVK